MNRRIRYVGVGLLIAASAITFAAQDAITLKFVPKVGVTIMYKTTAKLQIESGPVTLAFKLAERVTKADADGYTVAASQSKFQLTFNGTVMPGPDNTDTTTHKRNGEITGIQVDEMSNNSWRMAELVNFIYPDKPVKIGDTWTYTVVADGKKGTACATANYSVESSEKIGAHNCLKIRVTYKETTGERPAMNDGYTWIDTKDGSLVKSTSTWTNAPIGDFPATGTVTTERTN